jgi:Asp-tRNA(Asn)/Glu-tRNA(Gln) amidotransferase A subunit family amidase
MLQEEAARAEARLADQCREITLPLHGVPVTVKDSLDIAGLATGAGSRTRLGQKAATDAVAVSRLRAAGAIVLGKTNTLEFISSYETDNFVAGRTNNPWDQGRSPDGSSGGEAAAIAACCSAGGIATDGGGSIRVPAHFCGIAGLKPTPGRIPVRGHFPVIGTPSGFVTNLGPMARTVADVRLLYEAMAGYDSGDPFSSPVAVGLPPAAAVRVGVWPAFYGSPVQPEIAAAIYRAARLLSAEPFEPSGLETAPNIWAFLFSALPAAAWRSYLGDRVADLHWTAAETIGKAMEAPPPAAGDILKTFAACDRMRSRLLRQMEDVPVLLTPVCGIAAFRHRTRGLFKAQGLFKAMMPAVIWNALGFPALTVPMAVTADGLPVGVQLVGRPWEEQTLLAVGQNLEDMRGPFPHPELS